MSNVASQNLFCRYIFLFGFIFSSLVCGCCAWLDVSGNPYAIKFGLQSNFMGNRVSLVSAVFRYGRVQPEDVGGKRVVDGSLSGMRNGFLKHV